jgi:enoyl-CoA hydratase/carnithine racemase
LTDILLDYPAPQVARITFNRPEVLNAFRLQMFQDLADLLTSAAQDPAIRVLLLTGSGRAFSAGIDLAEQSALFADGAQAVQAAAGLHTMQALTRQMLALPKPLVAALNGTAVGVGAELALACDIRIGADGASLAFAETKRALFQTNGVLYLLPRLVGHGWAQDLLLTGRTLTAAEAGRIGLITALFPDHTFAEQAIRYAAALAANAPISMRLAKEALQQTWESDLAAMLQLETEGMLHCLQTADFQEGVRAFLEKRAPTYRGA